MWTWRQHLIGFGILYCWRLLLNASPRVTIRWRRRRRISQRLKLERRQGRRLAHGMRENVFQYKAEVMQLLLQSQNHMVLRSVCVTFERTREHHAWVAKPATKAGHSLRHLQCWSHPTQFLTKLVLPSVQRAVLSPDMRPRTGQTVSAPRTSLEATAEDLTESQAIFHLHMRTIMEMVYQLLLFVMLPQSPPWSTLASAARARHMLPSA